MKRRGLCVHQQNLQASASSNTSSTKAPAPKRNVAAAACLRLYAEGQEFLDHKKQIYSKYGLEKIPVSKAAMGSTTAGSRGPTKPETAASTTSRIPKPPVNQVSRSSATTKRASVQGIGLKSGDLTATGIVSPSKDKRSSTVYVPSGGRSPTATTLFAKTYSLQSTVASRAAVAPRRKTTITRKPPSPKTAKKDQGAMKQDRLKSANPSVGNRRVNTTAGSLIGSQLVHQNQHSGSRPSFSTGSPEVTRGTRASMISPHSGTMRRPSAVPIQPQQKSRTYSTIFQQQQQQEPVLVQVSRRTSSPIVSPGGPGGRRRPSVAPIEADSSPINCVTGSSDSMGLNCSPRASFIRRDNKLEKLQEQVNVLKASLGISDEDLLWKVESSKGNAFVAADRHLSACEERYDRLVFEMQELSRPARCEDEDKANVALAAKLRSLEKQAQQVAELKTRATSSQSEMVQTKKTLLSARVQAELQRAKLDHSAAASTAELEIETTKRLERIKEEVLAVQQVLKTEQGVLQTLLEWLGTETDRFGASFAAEDLAPCVISEQTHEAKRSLLYTLRTIPECTQGSERLSSLCSQATQLASQITASRAHDLKRTEIDLERTMRDVEIWKTRRDQAKEFADEMRKREAKWQETQREKNDESLALMRTFIPVDVADLSVETLIARAQEGGVLYTYDLAAYLKTNRFLHWLVTHEDDITRANFLAIESASFFMDFGNYDIQELRALARVLPDSFAFDKDGRKNMWRSSYIDHVRQLAAQQQHETIKAGWDPVKRARRDVQLPDLTARQQLNPIFCYPTDAEIDNRLDKFERQRARLEAKRVRLKKLDDELIPQAKAEYVAVAEDARNEELQRSFGKTTLIALREEAKQQHLALCKERDVAKGELAHGERAWTTMTPSFEQYQAEVAQIRALDPEIRNLSRIHGPFPAEIDIQPRERAAFKKLSVEEEAEARKKELDNAIAKRGLDINEVAEGTKTEAIPVELKAKLVDEASPLTEAELEATRLMKLEDKPPTIGTESSAVLEISTEKAPLSRGFKRVKSLQVAVGVLQFLEKDFCSPTRVIRGKEGSLVSPSPKAKTPATEGTEKSEESAVKTPRGSRSFPITRKAAPKLAKDEEIKAPKPPVVVQPKSKALLKLLEARKTDETSTSSPTRPPPSPFAGNFLGELQNRFQRKPSGTQVASENEKTPGAKKPMNFLDELKRKAGGDASPATPQKPMNFLDELKSASRKAPTNAESTTATISAPSVAGNFLDELKACARPI
ncbi:hypothetical protein V7S43_016034 [Phytophthora oleae]|uniref:Uncharacterized protein n=1 Tax=Phytophthora oleae TaxID=2107226 RepID=A0ABD3EXH3_9STRA